MSAGPYFSTSPSPMTWMMDHSSGTFGLLVRLNRIHAHVFQPSSSDVRMCRVCEYPQASEIHERTQLTLI